MTEQDEIITLVDEEGAEHDFTVVDIINVDQSEYAILLPVEEESDEAIILKFSQDEDGNELLLILRTMMMGKGCRRLGRNACRGRSRVTFRKQAGCGVPQSGFFMTRCDGMSVKATRIIISLILAAAFIVFMFFLTSGFFSTASEKVLPGVEVMDVNWVGLTGRKVLTGSWSWKRISGEQGTLRFEDRSWQLLLNETGFELNEEIMDAALSAGRHGSLYQRGGKGECLIKRDLLAARNRI